MTAPSSDHQALIEGIEATIEEAGGIVHCYVFYPDQGTKLELAAENGDRFAAAATAVIMRVFKQVQAAPSRTPALWLCCPRPVREGGWAEPTVERAMHFVAGSAGNREVIKASSSRCLIPPHHGRLARQLNARALHTATSPTGTSRVSSPT